MVWATRKQTISPHKVGIAKAAAVHFQLAVSFLMVRHVVPQGKCSKQKSSVQSAVVVFQPLSNNNAFNWNVSSSVMLPAAI